MPQAKQGPVKILIYGINFSPELTGVGKYTGEMAQWLARAGHDVRVVTAPPYYPTWKIADGYHPWRYQREEIGGVDVWRAPIYVPGNPRGISRLLHLASFALSSAPLVLKQLRWKPDVIWVPQPTLFCAPMALLAGKLGGAKTWLHIQDFEVNAGFGLGLLKGSWLRKLILSGERRLMNRFDRISSISDAMAALAREKTRGRPVAVFPNWVDLDVVQPLDRASRYRESLGIGPGATVMLYSGNMGAKQGLHMLSNAAIAFKDDPSIVFVFCGDGAYRETMERECAGLANVRFLKLQPLESLNELLGVADIHLLPQRADVSDVVLPSKLTGMLASGRPIVATAPAGSTLARAVGSCGRVVEPDDHEAFKRALTCLADDRALRERLGRQARVEAVQKLSQQAILRRFEFTLRTLLTRRTDSPASAKAPVEASPAQARHEET
ncbi:MAG: glycosyltransferase WbuB [Burkholderiaceae bacterium]